MKRLLERHINAGVGTQKLAFPELAGNYQVVGAIELGLWIPATVLGILGKRLLKKRTKNAMKRIKLTQNKYALIDNEDFKKVSKFNWYAKKISNIYYATHGVRVGGKDKTVFLHQFILNFPNKLIDHKDRNGLNNQKENLRICTPTQNGANKIKQSNKTSSKYKGVYWHRLSSRWVAQVGINNKCYNLGSFKTESEAAKIYNKKARELFGNFARLNIL